MSGAVTSQIQQGPKMVGVRVWIPSTVRASEQAGQSLRLRAPDGHLFPVKRVARVTPLTGQPQIRRYDLKRMIAVTGRISGRDLGSVMRDVTDTLQRAVVFPSGVSYRLCGLYAQQQAAFEGFPPLLIQVNVQGVILEALLHARRGVYRRTLHSSR